MKGSISRSKSISSEGPFNNYIIIKWGFFTQRYGEGEWVWWAGLEIVM